MNTYELVYPYAQENKKIKLENASLRDEMRMSNEKQKQFLMELEHYQRVGVRLTQLLSERDDDYKRYNINYDNQKKGIEQELKKAYDEIREMRGQAIAYEQLVKQHAKLQDEKDILLHKIKLLSPIDAADSPGVFKTNPDLQKKVDLLQTDKDYLTRENIKLTEMNRRIESKNDELVADLAESKRSVQKYLEELLDARQNTGLSFEKRLNEDLAAIRDKHAVSLA